MSLTIKRPTKIVDLILDGDLLAEHEKAERALNDAKNLDVTDPREIPRAAAAARVVTEIDERMKASAVRFTLQGLGSRRWAEEVASRQVASGTDKGDNLTVNRDNFDPLIQASILRVENPDGTPADFRSDEFPALADEMTNDQYLTFATAVLSLNTGWPEATSGVPFSATAWSTIQLSGQTSKRPSAEGSASSD